MEGRSYKKVGEFLFHSFSLFLIIISDNIQNQNIAYLIFLENGKIIYKIVIL